MAKLNPKTILYLGGGIVTVVAVYFGVDLLKSSSENKKYKASMETPPKKTTLGTDDISSGTAQQSNDAYPLKVGSYGAKVFVLQEALNKLGKSLTPDGKLGNMTYDAVKSVSGFGMFNFACVGYTCSLDYEQWNSIIKKAEAKGFDTGASWTRAKKLWTV